VIARRARERGELGELVHPAVHHLPEHLPLAVGECGKAPLEVLPLGTRDALVCITLESPLA